jgi:Mg2+/citrate symporter
MHGSALQVRYLGIIPSANDSGSLPWSVSLGGRFLAPFLRSLGLTDVEIGLALALQLGLMNMLGPWGGKLADVMESQNPGRGRAQVLTTGIL